MGGVLTFPRDPNHSTFPIITKGCDGIGDALLGLLRAATYVGAAYTAATDAGLASLISPGHCERLAEVVVARTSGNIWNPGNITREGIEPLEAFGVKVSYS